MTLANLHLETFYTNPFSYSQAIEWPTSRCSPTFAVIQIYFWVERSRIVPFTLGPELSGDEEFIESSLHSLFRLA